MSRAGASMLQSPADVVCRRIEKMLSSRARYKYVSPFVVRELRAYVVRSPCCSRTVDTHGGEIDIARIECLQEGLWILFKRDDAGQRWCTHSQHPNLSALMAHLVGDPEREFWR